MIRLDDRRWFDRYTMELVLRVSVCVVGVLVIAGNHGDASVDNLLLQNMKPLLEDNIKSTDAKFCHRPCKINVKPKRCHFKLVAGPIVMDDGRVTIAVNGSVPGPALHVCANDIVVAEVANRIPDQELAVHWHGVEQRGTPYMDGVPMITQCPIGYGATYKYAFRASSAGTYFYHASSVSHQADGVFGALVVSQPAPLEPAAALYDYDRSAENTLVLAATFPDLFTANLQDLNLVAPTSLTINGLQDSYKVFVTEGFGYRLRFINAIPIECPLVVSVDTHQLVAIATDGHPVRPTARSRLVLYPGERMDAVLRAERAVSGYWLRVRGLGTCAGLEAASPLLYSGYNYTSMMPPHRPEASAVESKLMDLQDPPLCGQQLLSLADLPPPPPPDEQLYLAVDRNVVLFRDADNDFRYISDAIPKKPFFPSQLTTREGHAVQINGKNFLFPNAPELTQPRDVKPAVRCAVGQEARHPDVQCLLTLEGQYGASVELVLVNEGAGSNDSYTFHMHGYAMQVVATSQHAELLPITRDQFLKWDEEGKIQRNLVNPPLKDSITVPNKGFTIVRLVLWNRGAWLLECRACGLSSLPTALLLTVPERLPKAVTTVLPRCGNFRPPDVLLN